MNDVVLDNDNGIIAVALKLYLERIDEEQGSVELYNRALELYHHYRDLTDE